MTLKKNTLNGNDSVFLYYFVQCNLKGKKKNIVSAENRGKRVPASTTVLYGTPSPFPLWPSGLWERECSGSDYL